MRRSEELNKKSEFVYILSNEKAIRTIIQKNLDAVAAGVAIALANKSGRTEAEAAERKHDADIYKNFEIKEGLVDIDDIEE